MASTKKTQGEKKKTNGREQRLDVPSRQSTRQGPRESKSRSEKRYWTPPQKRASNYADALRADRVRPAEEKQLDAYHKGRAVGYLNARDDSAGAFIYRRLRERGYSHEAALAESQKRGKYRATKTATQSSFDTDEFFNLALAQSSRIKK